MSKRTLAGIVAGLTATVLAPVPALAGESESTAVYFAAEMVGKNEVPAKDGPAVGDKNGSALAVFQIHGTTVSWAVRWEKIGTPTGFHIHRGQAGVNGEVVIPFFGEAMPSSALAVMGSVEVKDLALLNRIKRNPGGWYANLHNKAFPGGAVRAQLRRIRPIRLSKVLATPAKESLWTVATGRQEVPAKGTRVGDPDGRAEWLFLLHGKKMLYAAAWRGIAAPVAAHIHRAPKGKNGPVAVPFFADSNGLPPSISGIAGAVKIKPDLAHRIRNNPKNWYANLHTGEFPGGAVRGQLRGYSGGW